MDNYIEEINHKIEILYERINKEKDVLLAYNLIEKGNSKYQRIFLFPKIINKNMQSGNYKRAVRYFFMAEKLMNDIEKNKDKIKKRITHYIIRD